MNVLDENIPRDQRELLQKWRVPIHQIGFNVGRKGLKDQEIIPLLHKLRRPTFFTRDSDFSERTLCHPRYCLVYLAINKEEVAFFVRRLLRHPEFDTEAKRMGIVVGISHVGLSVWRLHGVREGHIAWY